jgi:hypothetical protein
MQRNNQTFCTEFCILYSVFALIFTPTCLSLHGLSCRWG